MPTRNYDVIVIGAGSMGSATCFSLASRGCRVLGLEQFSVVPHEQGSHTGQSRIIRKAYFEHADYVPLLDIAYEKWRQLEQATAEQLYFRTGLLYSGPSEHEVIKGLKEAAGKYHIELNNIPLEQQRRTYPVFHLPENHEMWLEPEAGFLLPEKSIRVFIREAVKKGATIKTDQKVLSWKREKESVEVVTETESYSAQKLIITAGVWAGKLISSMPLKITRQVIVWVAPEKPSLFLPERFPCWMMGNENGKGAYYGFPYLSPDQFPGPAGLKFALHYPDKETDPDQVNRRVGRSEIKQIIAGIKDYFPALNNKVVAARTCLYANSPDEHFIIDHLPGYDGDVSIACGFSGHGFKFIPVVGEILADLAMEGKTKLPADFLRLKRFQKEI